LDETVARLRQKYRSDKSILRWSLKPVWLQYLLSTGQYQEVIYVDPDICFFSNPGFLFDELSTGSILLSPHWRSTDPEVDPVNFELNFMDGIYNGGFLGASQHGIDALRWLTKACLYKCEIDRERGLYYDQKYFDLLSSRFEGVREIMHRGCNVASWNRIDCKRELVGETVLINGSYPIVFIHFTRSTIQGILGGKDVLLVSYLEEYQRILNDLNSAHVGPQIRTVRKKGFFQRTRLKFSSFIAKS